MTMADACPEVAVYLANSFWPDDRGLLEYHKVVRRTWDALGHFIQKCISCHCIDALPQTSQWAVFQECIHACKIVDLQFDEFSRETLACISVDSSLVPNVRLDALNDAMTGLLKFEHLGLDIDAVDRAFFEANLTVQALHRFGRMAIVAAQAKRDLIGRATCSRGTNQSMMNRGLSSRLIAYWSRSIPTAGKRTSLPKLPTPPAKTTADLTSMGL